MNQTLPTLHEKILEITLIRWSFNLFLFNLCKVKQYDIKKNTYHLIKIHSHLQKNKNYIFHSSLSEISLLGSTLLEIDDIILLYNTRNRDRSSRRTGWGLFIQKMIFLPPPPFLKSYFHQKVYVLALYSLNWGK